VNIRLFFVLFVSILCLQSCGSDKETFDPAGNRYLPLQVGNYWKLVPSNPNSATTIEMTVTEEVVLHGRTYFKIHQYVVSPPEQVLDRYIYFRVTEDGFIYALRDPAVDKEENILRLGAPDGHVWDMEGTHVSVSILTDEINGHIFSDCKSFFYNDPAFPDDESTISYASGIGYLRVDGGFGRNSRLSVAIINGIEHNFDE